VPVDIGQWDGFRVVPLPHVPAGSSGFVRVSAYPGMARFAESRLGSASMGAFSLNRKSAMMATMNNAAGWNPVSA